MTDFYDQNGNLSYSLTITNGQISSRVDYGTPGSATFTTSETDYNAAGLVTQEKVVYQDGHYDVTQFDTTNTQSWSSILSSYSAAGVKSYDWTYERNGTDFYHGYDADGAQPWTDVIDGFYPSGNLSDELIYYPDHTYTANHYDVSQSQFYTSYIQHYNAQGLNDVTLYQLRGGGTLSYTADTTGTQPWAYYSETFDANGQFVSKTITDRDGGKVVVTNDHTDTQSWATIVTTYAPSGAVAALEQIQHDGTYTTIQYDLAGATPWTSDQKNFTIDGQLASETILYRTGQISTTPYTTHPVTNPINTYDASGRVLSTTVLNTDGTKQITDFCYDSSEPWVKDVSNETAGGLISRDSVYFANGSSEVTSYSTAANVAFTSAYYDGLGHFQYQWTVAPDGSKQYYAVDQSGSSTYGDVTDRYSASGLFYDEVTHYKDGTFIDYQVNQQTSPNNIGPAWTTKLYTYSQSGALESLKMTLSDQTSTYSAYDYNGSKTWLSFTDVRNSGGQVVIRYTVNHDGSSSALVDDVTNSYSWLSHALGYNASGALTYESYQNDDGTVTTTNYSAPGAAESSRTTHYNVAGQAEEVKVNESDGTSYDVTTQYVSTSDSRVVSTYVTQSSGASVHTLYDPTGATTFTSRVDSYNISGQLASEVTNNRDLSMIVETFDPTSSQAWSDIKKTYASSGALSDDLDKYHDGTSTDTKYDLNNSQIWSSMFVAYDNQGRQVSTLETLHNGTSQLEVFNPTGTASYQDYIDTKTATGALQTHEVDYADGSRALVQYDVANTQVWASETFGYDNQGRTTYESIANHDGTSSVTVYDVAMTSSELYHTYSYNAAGQQTFLHVAYTNGTTYDHSFI